MTQYDDAVGNREGLRHHMGNDYHADSADADSLDHLETAPGLFHAERGEGFIEQRELAAPVDEPVKLDRLTLTA